MKSCKKVWLVAVGTLLLPPLLSTASSANDSALDSGKKKPKLILQITVDQLRGDLPTRYYGRLGEIFD